MLQAHITHLHPCNYHCTGLLLIELQYELLNRRKLREVDAPLSITLSPMEIRTFSCQITRHNATK